jgi:Uncharacterized conserved protein
MPVRKLVLVSLFAALLAIGAWLYIPATVPITLQTLVLFLAVGLLGGKYGTIAVAVYITLGAIGLPVFSEFRGGFGMLIGNTGGYIIGFLGATLTFWLITHFFGQKTFVLSVAMAAGQLMCYVIGTAWFMIVYTQSNGAVTLWTVLTWCVIPFIIPDALKIALAVVMTKKMKKHLRFITVL